MKFGNYYEACKILELQPYYLNYKNLKQLIKQYVVQFKKFKQQQPTKKHRRKLSIQLGEIRFEKLQGTLQKSFISQAYTPLNPLSDTFEIQQDDLNQEKGQDSLYFVLQFINEFQQQVENVEQFISSKIKKLEEDTNNLEQVSVEEPIKANSYWNLQQRQKQMYKDLYRNINLLINFVQSNYLATKKIKKKAFKHFPTEYQLPIHERIQGKKYFQKNKDEKLFSLRLSITKQYAQKYLKGSQQKAESELRMEYTQDVV